MQQQQQHPVCGLWFSAGYTPKGSPPPDMKAVETGKDFSGGQEAGRVPGKVAMSDTSSILAITTG